MTTKHQVSRLKIYVAWKQQQKNVLKDFLLFLVIPTMLHGFKD